MMSDDDGRTHLQAEGLEDVLQRLQGPRKAPRPDLLPMEHYLVIPVAWDALGNQLQTGPDIQHGRCGRGGFGARCQGSRGLCSVLGRCSLRWLN